MVSSGSGGTVELCSAVVDDNPLGGTVELCSAVVLGSLATTARLRRTVPPVS